MKIAKEKKYTNPTVNDLVSFYYQERFLKNFLILISGLVVLQTGFFVLNQETGGVVFNVILLVSLAVNAYILRKKRYDLASSLLILIVLSLLMYSIFFYGLSNITIFWFFAFPVLASFLKGKRGGALWLLFLVLIIVGLFLASQSQLIQTVAISYDAITFRQLIASIFIVAIFVYFYQDNLDQKESAVHEREKKLNKIYTQLQDEIKEHKATADTLAENLELIEEEKAKDEALLQSIREGIFAVNTNGQVITVNPAVKLTFNVQEKDLVKASWDELFQLVDQNGKKVSKTERPLQKTLDTGKEYQASNYFYLNYNKEKVPIAITTAPVFLKGKIYGAIEVFRDISHEKAMESAKDEFVSLASHQLHTPLSSIKWYAESLLQKKLPQERNKKYIKAIYTVSTKMTSLVNDFLNVSRLELGASPLNITPFDIPETVEGVLKELQPAIEDKKIKVIKKYVRKAIAIESDKKLLELVLQNLLSNAIKYTPEKGSITISSAEYSDDKSSKPNQISITVEDTGMGIPLPEQAKIFTKLFRASNALASGIEGTGLGLYAVKSAVANLNGKIWFESKPGKGTLFAVVLPKKTTTKKLPKP